MESYDTGVLYEVFVMICSIWLLCLKFGFALVEASKTHPRNVFNILFKNVADTFVSFVAFWLHGYAFAFGEYNNIIGTQFFLTLDNTDMVHFFFNYVRCAVATTLALGAPNERTEPIGYLLTAYVFSGVVYPLACHWVWNQQGDFSSSSTTFPSQDYAGSGVVFLLGGTVAAVSLWVIGHRAGRWSPHFKQRDHNPTVMVMGTFLQLLGFLGLVLGSHSSAIAAEEIQLLGLCAVNLLLAAASGGLYGLIIHRIHKNTYDLDSLLGGAVAGMVAVCAGIDTYIPGVAVLCGATAGLIFLAVRFVVTRTHVDDPLNIIAIYLVQGLWGLVYAGLFSDQGTLSGHSMVLGNNCILAVILFSWAAFIMYPLLSLFLCLGVLRVPCFMHKQGIDQYRHGLKQSHGIRKS